MIVMRIWEVWELENYESMRGMRVGELWDLERYESMIGIRV